MIETSPVSVKSTVSICMPLSTVAESSRCTAMVGPHVPTPLSQSVTRKKGPSVLLVDAILVIAHFCFQEILLLVVKGKQKQSWLS